MKRRPEVSPSGCQDAHEHPQVAAAAAAPPRTDSFVTAGKTYTRRNQPEYARATTWGVNQWAMVQVTGWTAAESQEGFMANLAIATQEGPLRE